MKNTSIIGKELYRKKRDVVIKRTNHPLKQLLISDHEHPHPEGEGSLGEQHHSGGGVTVSEQHHRSEKRILFDRQHPLSKPEFIRKEGVDILCYLNDFTVDIHIKFREKVCLECCWSIATYYRKIRSKNNISDAEFEKICEVYKDMLTDAVVDFYAMTGTSAQEASPIFIVGGHFIREGNFDTLWFIHYMCAYASRIIRDEICSQCDWSIPTYYRKMRETKLMSNADFEKICKVYTDFLKEMLTDFERTSRGLWPICNE
jgi:hypothetical protein